MSQTAGIQTLSAERRFTFGWPWMASLALAIAFVVLFWDFLQRQATWAWTRPSDWGHTAIIPLIAMYLAFLNRARLLRAPWRTSWSGLAVIFTGVSWYLLCLFGPQVLYHHNLLGFGVVVCISGLVVLLAGWRVAWLLTFPLVYLLVFGQSISERLLLHITERLQDWTARGSSLLLSLGLTVDRDGNLITIVLADGSERPLNVAEACSGMRMLMAFLALGVVMAYSGLRHTWQRVLLVLLGVPTAIFVNILRVVTLGMLAIYDTGFAAGDFHSFIGLVWLVPAFLIYLGLMWIIRHLVVETSKRPAPDPIEQEVDDLFAFTRAVGSRLDRRTPYAVLAACATLVISGVVMSAAAIQADIFFRKAPAPLRNDLASIPRRIGPWQARGDDVRHDASIEESLGTTHYLNREYTRVDQMGRAVVAVHIAYYTGFIDPVPHVPDRCMVAAGFIAQGTPENHGVPIDRREWTIDEGYVNHDGEPYRSVTFRDDITGRPVRVHMPFGEVTLRTTPFAHPDHAGTRWLAGYSLIANGHMASHPNLVRLLAFDRSQRHAYYCKVQFMMVGDQDFEADQFIEITSDLYERLLPHLMECLPDWTEYDVLDVESAPAAEAGV